MIGAVTTIIRVPYPQSSDCKMNFLLMIKNEFLSRNEKIWNDKFHGFHDQQCYVMLRNAVGPADWIFTHGLLPSLLAN